MIHKNIKYIKSCLTWYNIVAISYNIYICLNTDKYKFF